MTASGSSINNLKNHRIDAARVPSSSISLGFTRIISFIRDSVVKSLRFSFETEWMISFSLCIRLPDKVFFDMVVALNRFTHF